MRSFRAARRSSTIPPGRRSRLHHDWHHACMRILIIGGTVFVGRHITEAALATGHDVTVFHRGRSGADLFPRATHLTGDRNENLSALSAGRWDATIDVCAYFPRQVRSLAETLDGRGGQYVFVSSTSAYRTPVAPGFTEDAPLAELGDPATEEVTDETYGGLKVACERLAAELFARGGQVLAPGGAADPIQVIDARGQGNWITALAAGSVTGTFHAVSPAPPFGFGDLLGAIAAEVAPPGTTLTWVDADFLLEAGETAESIPLWPGGDPERDINAADPARALAAGLAPRPIRQTVADIHAAEQASPTPPRPGVGLTPDREAELLAAWRAR